VRILLLLPLALTLSGCAGVRFADIPQFNRALPDDYRNRVLWKEVDIFKYNLAQLAGHVVTTSDPSGGRFERGARILGRDTVPTLQPIRDGTLYHSKIDRDASVEGDYLAFAAKLSDRQTADVVIVDTSQVFIPFEEVPVEALLAEAAKERPTPSTRRYYIQGVLLATVTTRYGVQIDAGASGVIGSTFGAKGKVFNEEDTVSKDVRISLLLIDLDELTKKHAALNARPMSRDELILASRASGCSITSIGNLPDR